MFKDKLTKLRNILKDKNVLFLMVVLFFSILIRINNLFFYNQWWADDGGAHLIYLNIVREKYRLPAMEEVYIAWHEPLYYVVLAIWKFLGELITFGGQDWLIMSQVFLSILGLLVAWMLARKVSNNKVANITVLLLSVLFVNVKLSAYVTNELLAQVGMVFLIFLFVRLNLFNQDRQREVFGWSVFLGLLSLVKMSVFILFLAVIIVWGVKLIVEKKKYLAKYIIILICIVGLINTPWFLYKNSVYGNSFSINMYEQEKQSLIDSKGWDYLSNFNSKVFTSDPYWKTEPLSFSSILISDTFSDYYNLFNDVEHHRNLNEKKFKTDNGRYSTPKLKNSVLRANQIGLLVYIIWTIGFIGCVWKEIQRLKEPNWQRLFLILLIIGGVSALVYNTLRMPYYDRGVLKAQFIYFVFPVLAILSFDWYWRELSAFWASIITVVPILLYIFFALPVLLVS